MTTLVILQMIDTNQVSTEFNTHRLLIENQVMRLIGELLVKNREAMSIEDQEKKEKEGLFDMAAEEAEIEAMMAQLHGTQQPAAQ